MSAKSKGQNIRVAVRCRPINSYEKGKGYLTCVECTKDNKVVVSERNGTKSYSFDKVFGPYSKQVDVYKNVAASAVEEMIEGYNCTIFAYGMTGSGKTFTMTGERSDTLRYEWETDPYAGLIPRALSHIFTTLNDMPNCDNSVRVSFMELYNEELFDLLSVDEEPARLSLYDDVNRKGSVIVKGLREVVVLNKEEVYGILEKGLKKRQVASTNLNLQSSRSHSVFTVTVHMKDLKDTGAEEMLKIGKLNLVDLAGSENIGRSGAIDKRAREAGAINQSLLTLGRVITSLVDHTQHIPYRESKLTRLLQDSLGGRTKTSIIATISAASGCLEETISTLDYANRAKNIMNKPEVNTQLNRKEMVRSYNEELERLRRDLEASRSKSGIFLDEANYSLMQSTLAQQRSRISELEMRREVLEEDLKSINDLYSESQAEVDEIREMKEAIEEEKVNCEVNLRLVAERLARTRVRLGEERYLRRAHAANEREIKDEASTLLTNLHEMSGACTNLHDKVDRLATTDSENRSAAFNVASTWLSDRLGPPLRTAREMGAVAVEKQAVLQDQLDALKLRISHDQQALLKDQQTLVKQLAVALANSAEETRQSVATEHSTVLTGLQEARNHLLASDEEGNAATTEWLSRAAEKLMRIGNDQSANIKKSNDSLKEIDASLRESRQALGDFVEKCNDDLRLLREALDASEEKSNRVIEAIDTLKNDLQSSRSQVRTASTYCEQVGGHVGAWNKRMITVFDSTSERLSSVVTDQAHQSSNICSLLSAHSKETSDSALELQAKRHAVIEGVSERCLLGECTQRLAASELPPRLEDSAKAWREVAQRFDKGDQSDISSGEVPPHTALRLIPENLESRAASLVSCYSDEIVGINSEVAKLSAELSTKVQLVDEDLAQVSGATVQQLQEALKQTLPSGKTPSRLQTDRTRLPQSVRSPLRASEAVSTYRANAASAAASGSKSSAAMANKTAPASIQLLRKDELVLGNNNHKASSLQRSSSVLSTKESKSALADTSARNSSDQGVAVASIVTPTGQQVIAPGPMATSTVTAIPPKWRWEEEDLGPIEANEDSFLQASYICADAAEPALQQGQTLVDQQEQEQVDPTLVFSGDQIGGGVEDADSVGGRSSGVGTYLSENAENMSPLEDCSSVDPPADNTAQIAASSQRVSPPKTREIASPVPSKSVASPANSSVSSPSTRKQFAKPLGISRKANLAQPNDSPSGGGSSSSGGLSTVRSTVRKATKQRKTPPTTAATTTTTTTGNSSKSSSISRSQSRDVVKERPKMSSVN